MNGMRGNVVRIGLLALTLILQATNAYSQTRPAVRQIVAEYAIDYADDVSIQAITFGIQIDGNWWTVTADRPTDRGYGATDYYAGKPPFPTFYFKLDRATLQKLYDRELNVLTAMAKSSSADSAPLSIEAMQGFEPQDNFRSTALSVAFHFWTREMPEKIPFGGEYTRAVHGAQASALYEQPGFRSAFFQILPGQHANQEAADQVKPFPSLFVVIDGGTAMARIGGEEFELRGREALFIPANVAHEFWNFGDIAAEGVLMMFGDGS